MIRKREFVWMGVAALLAFLYVGHHDIEAAQATELMVCERTEAVAGHYASILAACMDGDGFVWTDPHSGKDQLVFCDNHPNRVRR